MKSVSPLHWLFASLLKFSGVGEFGDSQLTGPIKVGDDLSATK